MISVQEALEIHKILIEQFSGKHGLRDLSLLESALQRPFQTFDGGELYSTPIQKSAAIMESIVRNHPFVDGNKRTGYVLARLTLLNNGVDIDASQNEKYQLVMKIAENQIDFDEIVKWLDKNTRSR